MALNENERHSHLLESHGLNRRDSLHTFQRLYALETLVNNIQDIYSNDCALIIKSNNKIFVAGWGKYSQWTQITDKNNINIISKGICNAFQAFMTSFDNKLYVNGPNPILFNEMNTSKWLNEKDNLIDIQCGSKHTIFVSSNNIIYGCGNNEYGQCVVDTNRENIIVPMLLDYDIKMVCCADWFTSLVTVESVGKCYGDLRVILHENTKIINTKCGARHALFLDCDGCVYTVGNGNDCGQRGFMGVDNKQFMAVKNPQIGKNEAYLIRIDEKIKDISCGGDHSMILSENNNL